MPTKTLPSTGPLEGVKVREWYDPFLAVFNGHCNNASSKAKRRFIKKHGRDIWLAAIQPYIDKGVMSIFNEKPNKYTREYVNTIHEIVNEGIEKPAEAD